MASLICLPQISIVSARLTQLNPRIRIKTRVEAKARLGVGTKDREIRVLDLDQNARIDLLFSAPVNKGDEDKQKYYVNTGYAIRTLRDEFPQLFDIEISFGIYRDDIVYKDPYNTFIGIENYKWIFSALRFYGRIFFKALWVDVISISQPVERGVIMVRWTVHGIPRVLWECHGRFDGTSEYKLDKEGKIYEHKVDNLAFNSPKKFRVLSVEELIQSLGVSSTAKPTYFKMSSSSILKSILLPVKFSWIKRYLAIK